MRDKAEKRKNDYKHAARKRKIVEEVFHEELTFKRGGTHRLSKNKIPCDTEVVKTKTDGYSHSDQKKLAAAFDQEIE